MDPAGFSFPLNAYAAMLQWSEGRADSLHYGLFEHAQEPIAQAQRRASDRLWALLPASPARVLEVGVGLGTTLARLRRAGHLVHAISPDERQVAAVRAAQPDASVEVIRLEDLQPADEPWELMLLQESAQYIEPVSLFDAAHRLLAPADAALLVMDEFALQRPDAQARGLHLLPDFLALAERCGWRLVHDEDVTPAARTTLDVLLALGERYRERLVGELAIPAEAVEDLARSNRRYRDCYASGVYGYRVLKFERRGRPARRLATTVPAHGPAMRALFERVFERPMSEAEWRWKYRRGAGIGLVGDDGALAAHYGGLSRPLALLGEPALGCQVCDVMVAPDANEALVRRGAFHDIAATFLEGQIGHGRPHAVGFGFPNERALRIAERLGLYRRVDEMVQVDWPATPSAVAVATVGEVDRLGDDDPVWAWLELRWREMADALRGSVLGVRDASWLRWRYRDRPGVRHRLLCRPAGPAGGAGGAAVLREHDGWLECLDVVGAPAAWPLLVQEMRHHAAAVGAGFVRAWVTVSHAHALRREGDAGVQVPLDLHVPANVHTSGVEPQRLQGRWFLMGGDTDFR